MYVRISDIVVCIGGLVDMCLNQVTGEFVPKQSIVNQEETTALLELPRVYGVQIKRGFINHIGNKALIRKFSQLGERDFENAFHRHITDQDLIEQWNVFENNRLAQIAIDWCNNHDIKFTTK